MPKGVAPGRKGNGQPLITPREQEIIRALAKGLTTREIARQLGITFNTVESHRKTLLKKFESKNTVQMMLKVRREKEGL